MNKERKEAGNSRGKGKGEEEMKKEYRKVGKKMI